MGVKKENRMFFIRIKKSFANVQSFGGVEKINVRIQKWCFIHGSFAACDILEIRSIPLIQVSASGSGPQNISVLLKSRRGRVMSLYERKGVVHKTLS